VVDTEATARRFGDSDSFSIYHQAIAMYETRTVIRDVNTIFTLVTFLK